MDAGMAAQGLSVVADPACAGRGEAECAAHRLSGGLLSCGAEAEGSAKIAGRTGPGDTRYLSKARHSAGGTEGSCRRRGRAQGGRGRSVRQRVGCDDLPQGTRRSGCHLPRSEEHTSELQSLMRISYAVFCLKKKKR